MTRDVCTSDDGPQGFAHRFLSTLALNNIQKNLSFSLKVLYIIVLLSVKTNLFIYYTTEFKQRKFLLFLPGPSSDIS